jgi:hypothetical protein
MNDRSPDPIMHRLLQVSILSLIAICLLDALTLHVKAAERRGGGGAYQSSDFGSPSRIEYLKAAIAIKERQQTQWTEYTLALQAFRKALRDRREIEVQTVFGNSEFVAGDSSFGERQDEYEVAKADLKDKYATLYAALDASQRVLADATLTKGECGR